MSSFGPEGTLVSGILPGQLWDERWFFFYGTCINTFCLLILFIGSKAFGITTVFILVGVLICTLLTYASFFVDKTVSKEYVWNSTNCISVNDTLNCEESAEGFFVGLTDITYFNYIGKNFVNNLWPKYALDCSLPGNS